MSKLKIANLALIQLGQEPLTALEGDAPTNKIVNAVIDTVIDLILSNGNWSFATINTELPPTPITEEEQQQTGFLYKFKLPNDFIKYVKHYSYTISSNSVPFGRYYSEGNYYIYTQDMYQVIGRYLFSNDSELKIQYVSNRDDVTYSSAFIFACVGKLKVILMPSLGENDTDRIAYENSKSDKEIERSLSTESRNRTNRLSSSRSKSWGRYNG